MLARQSSFHAALRRIFARLKEEDSLSQVRAAMANAGHNRRAIAFTNTACIIAKHNIQSPMQRVLYARESLSDGATRSIKENKGILQNSRL